MRKVIAFDLFNAVEQNHGNYYVRSEISDGEHHMTNRADARRFLRSVMGPKWEVLAFQSLVHYRRADGYMAHARLYSAVRIG
jgi:hypothetical protein